MSSRMVEFRTLLKQCIGPYVSKDDESVFLCLGHLNHDFLRGCISHSCKKRAERREGRSPEGASPRNFG
jgi:hypothetical protein